VRRVLLGDGKRALKSRQNLARELGRVVVAATHQFGNQLLLPRDASLNLADVSRVLLDWGFPARHQPTINVPIRIASRRSMRAAISYIDQSRSDTPAPPSRDDMRSVLCWRAKL
jgi:hypothetical protein